MKHKKVSATYSMDEPVVTDLKAVWEKTGIPQSRIVNQAVKEKVAAMKERLQKGEEIALCIN